MNSRTKHIVKNRVHFLNRRNGVLSDKKHSAQELIGAHQSTPSLNGEGDS